MSLLTEFYGQGHMNRILFLGEEGGGGRQKIFSSEGFKIGQKRESVSSILCIALRAEN